jgi:hypothetical protein
MSRLSITKILVARVDAGDAGRPGDSATQAICEIWARRNGRYEAVGSYETGSNQGYFRADYEYGPWTGVGSTPAAAVQAMVDRAGSDYARQMRAAGHDALVECGDTTFAGAAAREADRIERVVDTDAGRRSARVCGVRYWLDTAEERAALRGRAVAILRRLAAAEPGPLVAATDDDLLAESRRRALDLTAND